MARYKVPRPNSEVALRNWGAGRVAQLKLFLGHLEQAVGVSLAAQVQQSPKRKFSEFVPKIPIQNITSEVEYKEIRVFFTPPKGLKNLLFYEYVISTNENFFQFDLRTSSDTNFVFPNLNDDTTYYIKIRVVTKDGLVGPYSDAVSETTPFSQAFGLYDGTEFKSIVVQNDFAPVFERPYTAIGGKGYYQIDYEIKTQIRFNTDDNVEWSDIELQWSVDEGDTGTFSQVGQNFLVTTYSSNDTTALGSDMVVTTDGFTTELVLPGTFDVIRRGTFIQKLTTLASGSQTIRLSARVLPSNYHDRIANDFVPNATYTSFLYGAPSFIKIKNFNIFEALVS